ncbi:hypothetical protein [Streptomyces tateyamensis]|uniref:hypothetical protein n=1 Tax=Streptomyces tateyamensis TaxID=565073 RepID=UPI0015E8C6FD|nr:hypothetical protein [Streptomyces tateyamensis]
MEVFRCAVDSARALGSRQDEAVHLNYLAWAYNTCVYDHHNALATAAEALTVARELGDQLQMGWALGYGATALHRTGRVGESITWLRDAAELRDLGHRPSPPPLSTPLHPSPLVFLTRITTLTLQSRAAAAALGAGLLLASSDVKIVTSPRRP